MTISTLQGASSNTSAAQEANTQDAINGGNFMDLESHQKIVSWANTQYKVIKNARTKMEREWLMNMYFYFGKQYITLAKTPTSNTGYKFTVPPAVSWRVRLQVNKIRKIIRVENVKLTKSKPTITIYPRTSDEADILAAQVGEEIWDNFYREGHINAVVRSGVLWAQYTGTSFLKTCYNPEAIDIETGQPGVIEMERVTSFHLMVPNFEEEDIEKQPFLIQVSARSKEWVENTYKDELQGHSINPNTAIANDILDDNFLNLTSDNPASREAVLCMEIWIKPGTLTRYPNGGLVIIAGDRVVQEFKSWPYEHGQYPFAKIIHVPTGRFYGESIITDLRPLQMAYNRSRSQLIENKNMMSKPKWIGPKGALDAARINTEPGQFIEYTPGLDAPRPVEMPGLPSYVLDEIQMTLNDIEDLSGQHEVSRGQNPSQVTAASALAYLGEQDDTALASTIESIENALEKMGRQFLTLVGQFWVVGRIIKVVGLDNTFSARIYKGKDLRGNFDLNVEAGSALPQSRAAKQAFVMDLAKLGIIPPDKVLEMLDIGGIQNVYNELQIDMKQVQRENLKMMFGEPIPVNDWDNHALHVQFHNNFRKTQQFEQLPEDMKVMWQQHVLLHQSRLGPINPSFINGGATPPPLDGGVPPVASGGAPPQDNSGAMPQDNGGQLAPSPDSSTISGEANQPPLPFGG